MRKVARSIRDFARETKGNVAILFGLAIIPIILAVGVAVDYGSALTVRSRMNDAADAAALAIGSWPDLSNSQLKAKAQKYFDANYPSSSLGTVGKLNVAFVGDDIHMSVSGSVPTTFMRLANINSVDVGASAVITKNQRRIELALVLDTTGSMGQGGKMDAMQRAAKKMVKTLFNDRPTSETLEVAVVPFSGAVNIGQDKRNSGWLDKAEHDRNPGMSSITEEDFDYERGESPLEFFDELERERSSWEWQGCVRERAEPYELTDDPPVQSVRETLFTPYLAPDEPDDDGYDNSYLDDGDCDEASGGGGGGWGGGWGWGRGGRNDPDPDEIQECTSKYDRPDRSRDGYGPNWNCPVRAVTALTNTRNTVDTAIDRLEPEGNTVIPAGLLWGWRVLSPGEPFTEGVSYDNEEWIKAIVLLTDGENMVSGGSNGHNESVYNAFGYADKGHLGDRNGREAEEELNAKTAEVCNAVKAKGILIYTIGFQVNDHTTRNLLRNCATKSDMYYNSPSNAQLASIFQDIAQGLSDLRIAR